MLGRVAQMHGCKHGMQGVGHGIAYGGTLHPMLKCAPRASATTHIDGIKLFEWPTSVRAQCVVCAGVQRGGL